MTYSLVARDPETGAFGVATATGGPAVGSLVPHAVAGVGALATQGFTNPLYAFDGLAALRRGEPASDVVAALTGADPDREKRQFIVVDAKGRVAGWKGKGLTEIADMILDREVAVAGNMLAHADVVPDMLAAFEATHGRPLETRLLAALRAGEAAGGDRRGTRSAALKTVTDQLYPRTDIRVDFSPTPLDALADLLERVRDSDYADFIAALPRRAPG